MKLHLPKSLRTALLSCLAAFTPWSVTVASGAISVGAVAFVLASSDALAAATTYSSSTETYNGETYAGHVFTLDLSYEDGSSYQNWGECNVRFAAQAGTKLMYYTYSTNEAGEEVKTENYVSTNATGPDGKTTWYSFLGANGSYDTEAGNTLRLTGATKDTVIGFDYAPISFGGLIVDACLGGYDYKLMAATGGGIAGNRNMELRAGERIAANMTIGADTSIELGTGTLTVYSGGEWNVADDINLIIKAGTAQLEAGVQVTLNGLGNLDLGTSALKMADGASIVVAEGATLELGANASGSTGAITNNGSVYLENRGSSFALTNNATGTVYLTGANSVATLNNDGTLSFAEGSTLTLGSMANDFYGGKTYDVGNLALTSGGAVSNWAPYFGYNDGTEMSYENGQLTVTVDGSGYYWNGTADSYSWSAANLLKGGNAATIAAGGRLYLTADAAYKTVNMDSTVALGGIVLQSDGYTLNVTADNVLPSQFVVGDSSYTLTKTGAATLSMTSEQAAKLSGMTVSEGTLALTDTLKGNGIADNTAADVDFSDITVAAGAILSIHGAERNGDSNIRTTVKLGENFTGKLKVHGGWLDSDSDLGNASAVIFDGGNLLGRDTRDNRTISKNIEIGATGATFAHLGNGGNGIEGTWKTTLSGTLSGSGNITFIENGDWYFTGDMDGFTGSLVQNSGAMNIFLRGNAQNLASFSTVNGTTLYVGTADKTVTVATAAGRTQSGNFTLDVATGSTFREKGSLEQTGGTFVVKNGGTYEAYHINLASGAKLDVQGSSKVNILGLADTTYTNSAGEIAIAAGAKVTDTRALIVDGDVRISGTGTYEQLGSLTINAGKTLTLSGDVTLSALTNNGTITFSALESLTLKGFNDKESYDGTECYAIGNVTGGDTLAWNELLGMVDRPVSYDATSGILSLGVVPVLQWVDTAADDESAWGEASNWQLSGGSSQMVPLANSKVLLSADAQYSDTVTLTGDVTVNTLTVARNHNLSVTEGVSATLSATTIALENGATLSKVGAGTLSMNMANATAGGIHISEGTLKLSDQLEHTLSQSVSGKINYDLTAITSSVSGILEIDCNGTWNVTGCDATAVALSDNFLGTLSVIDGQLLIKFGNEDTDGKTIFGGASALRLDKAALYFIADDSSVDVADIIIGSNGAYITNRSSISTISSDISGSGNLTIHTDKEASKTIKLTGAIDLDGVFTQNKGTLILDSSTKAQFDGGIVLNANGTINFNSDADMASLSAVGGSHILVDNGATLNTATTAVSGTVTTGATEGATFNMGAVTIANNGTLDVSGTGNHVIDRLDMTAATTNLTLGEHANLTVGTWVAEQNGDTETVSISLGAGAELAYTSTLERKHINQTVSVTLGAESTIKDAGVMKMSGGKLTVSGNGVYELAGLQLSGAGQGITTALEVGAGTTLHITGTTNNDENEAGAFFTHNWGVAQNSPNTISVSGVLALECGISSAEGYGVITVNSGGKLAFNRGLTADSRRGNRDTININGGGVLEVSGTNVTGTNSVTVNVNQNGIVMGGNANGATESKITNNLVFDNGAYIGAKKGTTLTIAPDDGSTSLNWMDIIGTADTHGSAQGAGGKVVFDSDVTVVWNVKVHAGAEADFNNALTMTGTQDGNGLYNYGTLTVDGVYSGKTFTNAAGAEATFNSGISLLESVGTAAVVDNSGKLIVNGTLSMYHFNNKAGAEAEINGDVRGSSINVPLIYNSGKVSFNGNVGSMHQIRNLEGGEMTFAGEMNGSHDALQNAGKLVFDGATVRLRNAILNGGEVEILNAADTQFVLSNGLMQEIVGVSKTWTLVNNTGVKDLTGTITGWDALTLDNFLLDGSVLQLEDWDGVRIEDGKVMLYMLSRYWDATGDAGVWNTGADANWREFADSTETVTFETNSRVTFTDTDETGKTALDKSVTVADGGVHAKSVTIAGTDYVFSGGKVLVNQSLSAQQNARFDSAVVIGSSAPLQLDVADGATLTLSTLETVSTQSYGGVSYGSGAFSKTGEGTLLITDAINGTITGATVSGGKLVLGVAGAEDVAKTVSLAVGSNTLTTAGGSLENVELLSSGTVTDYTGATAQANNVIKSADGVNYAMLTDVALRAGAATGYASLQKVAFAGNSTLSGYITYESTKQQRQMAVATGGTLTVSNLTFDLHGLSTGTKVLIENKAVANAAEGFKGTLLGWNSDNVTLLYSGIAVNSAAVNMGTAGVVELLTAENNEASRLYWDGLVAGAASSAWDKSSANWSTTAGTDGSSAFLALSNAYFGATPEGGSKVVNAAQDMVMGNMFVTEGGYSFTGSRLATLGNMHITPASGAVSFANDLVAQGNVELRAEQDGSVTLGGALQAGGTITATGEGDLSFNSTVQSGGDITLTGNGEVTLAGNVSTAGKFSIGTEGAAVMDKADASTLYTIEGTLTAKDILINMDASTLTAAADTGDHLVVSGNVSAMGDSATPAAADGTITLLGSAAKKFTGFVTADTLRVNAAHDTLNNVITFTNVVDVNTLEIAEDTYVRIVHADSDMDTVLLGGTLYMDTVCVTYDNGYDIYSTSDAAELVFGTISSNTINLISGLTPAEAADDVADADQYNSISVNANTRFLTVNALANLKDLTLYNGPMTVNAGEGAIHGNLVVRDAAGLTLTQNANNIMAEGSHTITVDHANMNLNSTTQTLRSGNDLYLAGGSITGNAGGVGLNFVGTSSIHYTGNSTVSANMTVATGSALTVQAGKQMEDTLTLSGSISGAGNITMQGDGRVLLSGANTAYTGAVTVQQQTGLKLGHVDALAAGTLNLAADGTLLVDRAAVGAPFNLGILNTIANGPVTLDDGTTLTAGTIQIHSLQAMDATSAADAAFNVGKLLVSADQVLNLTLSFAEGESLQTMKTYNLFTSTESLAQAFENLNLELYIAANNIANHVASSQYKLVYDDTANVIALRTMLGNIWDGGADGDGDGIWAVGNDEKNWTGKDYDESSAYNDAIFADLTGEGIGGSAVVTINGTVNPGEIYFEADNTKYELNATGAGNMLAAGNVIHKAGAADVTLNLANNGTAASALGGMDLQAGNTTLAADLAVAGEVSVAAGATLQTGGSLLKMVGGDAVAYTAQGTYSGLTLDAVGIAGVAGAAGTVTNGIINGAAELDYLSLTGTGTLTGVTIGSGVNVATGADYTLNGHITFLDTLLNAGEVTLDATATVEIGSLGYTYGVAGSAEEGAQYGVSAGGSYYKYQLIQNGTINGMSDLTVEDVYINGVKLGGSDSGLAKGMAAVFTNNDGVLTLSIGAITSEENQPLTVDGTVGMPSWDERWGKSEAEPALSRRYAGTDAEAKVSFAEDAGYLYGAVVNEANAAKVNGGKAVVVTLSSAATGNRAAGGSSATNLDHEIWMYDRSGFDTVIAGQYAGSAADYTQLADTHVLVNSTYDGADDDSAVDEKAWVVGGSWNVAQQANSYVTMQDGQVLTLVGGSVNSNQTGTSYVYIDGGRVFEVVGASYADAGKSVTHTAAEGETLASHLVITGGELGGAASDGGTKSVYGGGIRANITGDILVTVDGTATITNLVGGNYAGSVDGDITLNLVSGSAGTVNAAGAGASSVTGDVNVFLSRDFVVTGGLYGGKQNNSGVTVGGTSTLYLSDAGEYVFAQWQGDAAGTHDGYNHDLVANSAVTIAGFDVVSLAQGTVLTVDTNHFDRDITGGTLVITGNGIVRMGGNGGARRDIRLENGATFKLLSSYTANNYGSNDNEYDGYSKLDVTDGTTFDISGYPRENAENDGGGSIAYRVYLSGDGVDGMGALYKGATDKNNSTNPSGKAALGYIALEGNASATAEHNIAMIGPNNATTYLHLNGYTFTKRGEGAYVLRNTVINGGTYYAHEGTVQPEKTSTGQDADLVLAAAATLKLNDNCNFTMRSLTGTGATDLGAYKLTLAPVSGGKYYAEFMDEANSYDNLMSGTGFAYGVYSGTITGSGSLYIGNKSSLRDRKGVQYLSGTDSTYSGGTHVEAGRLYLLSSTQGSISKGGSEVTSGPIGTGALYWDSTTAEVYLGHGVTVYNAGGTNVAGSDLILGVEGAPDGDLLKNYPGVNGTVVKDGVTYHEVDTHNLQSISCNGVYADGTLYVAGTEIDRNKMLLVTEDAWNSESSTVKGFTDTGYNEATYSGVLSGEASLVKVGDGTLVIDQANAYTGGTRIEAGTLKLKGWAQIGAAADGTIDVTQTAGSTLMLAYDGTYGDELSSISNNMVLNGKGDARWVDSEETGGDTAALISDVGTGVTFTLSGNISGEGNLLHSGEGTLVLSGDSTYTGGTHATRGVVEVQSATGLGAGKVNIDSTADLHVTVEEGTTDARVATTLATAGTTVQGDVVISGTESTERILNVATGGYNNSSTTLHDNGTLLVNGAGVAASTGTLSGSGTVAVSDATGTGAKATVGQMTAYTGDFVVEGNKASITVENGSYSGGSISVSGNDAVLSTKGDITITNGESLSLSSRGNAGAENDAAYVTTTGSVSVASGATLSVSDAATSYEYNLQNLQNLQAAASLNGVAALKDGVAGELHGFGANVEGVKVRDYFYFNSPSSDVMNSKAAGAVDAKGGLTMASGATYETAMANTSLMGGSLTLESGLTLSTTLDLGAAAIDGSGRTTQLVLFSDVNSVNFVLDNINAVAKSGIYYTKAENYITGNYIDEDTWLVYDSGAGVVYLDGIVPEPTTATLSLLALAALAARRRRR